MKVLGSTDAEPLELTIYYMCSTRYTFHLEQKCSDRYGGHKADISYPGKDGRLSLFKEEACSD